MVDVELGNLGAWVSHYEPGAPDQDRITLGAQVWIRSYSDTMVEVSGISLDVRADNGLTFTTTQGQPIQVRKDGFLDMEVGTLTRGEWNTIGSWEHTGGTAQLSWAEARPADCIPDSPILQVYPKPLAPYLPS
ncbi:hypothetical protein [Microbacterium sp. NPDC058389]|uniref:hypothetical protein n=1 Tax=Microbacterium sp. NPDC058389 TaxID=3346475 RepID=UPI00364EC8CE